MTLDLHSLGATAPSPTESLDLLVIGAGAAGARAAIEGAKAGLKVVLIDEHPLDPGLIGLDVPYAFGQRATAAVQNRQKMIGQIVGHSPLIAEAFEQNVEVRLGTTAWGLFPPSPEARMIDGLQVGLEDGERAWIARCGHVILATGARDIMLGFEGCDQPGVMGSRGLHALLHQYEAADVRRLLILGSDSLACRTALDAREHGIEVVGLVEPGARPLAGPDDLAALSAAGVDILTRTVIVSAGSGPEGVDGAILVSLDDAGASLPDSRRRVDCDTICAAILQTPSVELLAAAGGQLCFDSARGVWRPQMEGTLTSIAGVQAVGACTGAEDDNQDAATAAAGLAAACGDRATAPEALSPAAEATAPVLAGWMEALIRSGGLDVVVCRCETVTRADILGVSPPAYLGPRQGRTCTRDLDSLLRDGPPDPDQIKRLTRAGMGECQGRRCREQTACLLARAAGIPPEEVPPATWRAPVRPLPLALISAAQEPEAMQRGWDSWFGIPTQFLPWWEDDPGGERRDGTGWHL